MFQEYSVTYYNDPQWKLPFNLAIAFHFLVIIGALYLPDILHRKPLHQNIYTVDIINISEPTSNTPPPVQAKITAPDKPLHPKAVSLSKAPLLPEIPPKKVISIKPIKQKIKKKLPKNTKKVLDETQAKKLAEIRRQKLAEALRAERIADQRAKVAAEEAVNELKRMIRTANTTQPALAKSNHTSTKRSSSTGNSAVENLYYASIFNRLHQFWSLPEYKEWDSSLTAVVVVTLSKKGALIDYFFEKRSGDRVFDQFVQKTVQDAEPYPQIPPVLKISRREIGLNFTPGSIQ